MSDNIRTLPGVQRPTQLAEPNESVIAVLENALARAKSGELQSLLGVGHTADGCRVALWADFNSNVFETLGSIAWLQHEYVENHKPKLIEERPA